MPWPRSDFHTTTDSMKQAVGIDGIGVNFRWARTVGFFSCSSVGLLSLDAYDGFVNTRHVGSSSLLDCNDQSLAPIDLGHSWFMSLTVSGISSGARWMGVTRNVESLEIPCKHAGSYTESVPGDCSHQEALFTRLTMITKFKCFRFKCHKINEWNLNETRAELSCWSWNYF